MASIEVERLLPAMHATQTDPVSESINGLMPRFSGTFSIELTLSKTGEAIRKLGVIAGWSNELHGPNGALSDTGM